MPPPTAEPHSLGPPVVPSATEALVSFMGQQDTGMPVSFDGADVSAEGLGARVDGATWWDAALGGVRLGARDLSSVSLRHANLSGADLSGANLSGASCSGLILQRGRLEEASFRGADLIGSVLTGVNAGEADFSDTLLEDANLSGARLRFADFTGAVMDGADLSGADFWGARLSGIAAERASFRGSRLDEAQLANADLSHAELVGATLRRANLAGARLRGANLREAVLDGANLDGADLSGAVLPHVSLLSCNLHHVRFAGAWLERTRMRAHQLGGATGEEAARDFEAARESYIVLEQNFRTLGSADDASWAFRRRRRMGKRLHLQIASAALRQGSIGGSFGAIMPGLRWLGDVAAEWLCDYGESVTRVLRAFLVVLCCFAAIYWLTGCLEPREGVATVKGFRLIDYLLFSLDSMTTVGTSEVGVRPSGQLGVLLSSVQTVMGTILLGLFGFVLGVRMRN